MNVKVKLSILWIVVVILFITSCCHISKLPQEDEIITIPFITEENRGEKH